MENVNLPPFIRKNTYIFIFEYKHIKFFGRIKLFLFTQVPDN